MSDTIKAQLQKILALAESGVGGERENARALLERMMARHGITMADLDDQVKAWVPFFCSKGESRDLLVQIVAITTQTDKVRLRCNHKVTECELTQLEAIEVRQLFGLLLPAWRKEKRATLKAARQAFLHRNNLLAPAGENDKPSKPMTPDEYRRLMALIRAHEPVQVRKALNV